MSLNLTTDRSRGLTIAQLILSILSLSSSLITLGALAVMFAIPGVSSIGAETLDQSRSLLWVIGLTALITLPSLILSIRRLSGNTPPRPGRRNLLYATIALLLVPLLVLLEEKIIAGSKFSSLSPLVAILAVIFPLWWFIELGRFRLNTGSSQRHWGVSVFSIFLTMPLVILAEMFFILLVLILGAAWLMQQPEFSSLIQQIQNQFILNPLDAPNLIPALEPLLARPEVLAVGLWSVALLLPMLEELIKPLAVWLFSKRQFTPAEGFGAGLVCGASFALLESTLALTAVTGDDWAFTVLGRVGAGLLHTVLSGLNGWALASAWQDHKFIRLGATYLFTVLVHGAWNLFAVFAGLKLAGDQLPLDLSPLLKNSALWVLGGLALLMLAVLIIANRRLRPVETPPVLPPETPPLLG